MLLADGFENAFIGTGVCNGVEHAVYDLDKCVKILVDRDGMTEEDAIEYIDYNVIGSLSDEVDDAMPVFFQAKPLQEVIDDQEAGQ